MPVLHSTSPSASQARPLCCVCPSLCLAAFISGFQCSPQALAAPHPGSCGITAEQSSLTVGSGETLRVATSSHLSLRTQVWEMWAGATLGIMDLLAWVQGEEVVQGEGTLPSQPPGPPLLSHNFPFLHFLHLPLPLLFTLPKYAQAVIMGPESSHTHTHTLTACPSVPAPSRPQSPPHGAPCRPRLMGARWPPGDSATGLWEPRRPVFPCPHTQLMLPQ